MRPQQHQQQRRAMIKAIKTEISLQWITADCRYVRLPECQPASQSGQASPFDCSGVYFRLIIPFLMNSNWSTCRLHRPATCVEQNGLLHEIGSVLDEQGHGWFLNGMTHCFAKQ